MPSQERRPFLFVCFALILVLQVWPLGRASAQGTPSGYEIAFNGSRKVVKGKEAHFRGIAYRVHGLAELRKLPNALVRSRLSIEGMKPQPWLGFRANSAGIFGIDMPIPASAETTAVLEVSVGDSSDKRVFEFPLQLKDAVIVDLKTDRNRYEPGETVHAWAKISDSQSHRPIVNLPVALTLGTRASGKAVSKMTGKHGVVSLAVPIPKDIKDGRYEFVAKVAGKEYRGFYVVGKRHIERMFAKVSVSPKIAQALESMVYRVEVHEPGGAPVRNAEITLNVDGQERRVRSDSKGIATITMQAPAYMPRSESRVGASVKVSHPALGQVRAGTSFDLVVPLTMKIEAVPDNGSLVPEIESTIYFRLSEGSNTPPALGTKIVVEGAAIAGGKTSGTSDKHGIVRIVSRLPKGAAATGQSGEAWTSLVVKVQGKAPTTLIMQIPVSRNTEVVPRVDKPVVAPGDTLSVRILRRASAEKVPVVVELLSDSKIVEYRVLKAGVNTLRFPLPSDRLGLFQVRARPLHQRSVAEGTGAVDAFLIRPAVPSIPELTADKKSYSIRDTAKLVLKTNARSKRSWVAVVARDLSAHSQERPFTLHYLHGIFDKAILDPSENAADTLLRTALADYVYSEEVPYKAPPLLDEFGRAVESEAYNYSQRDRDVFRDPFPIGEELQRRGVGEQMNRLERAVAEAVADGDLSGLVKRVGGRTLFHPDVFSQSGLWDELPRTLGDEKLTIAMLRKSHPTFGYDTVGRRVARKQLVGLLVALAHYLDPGDDASPEMRAAAREPSDRWLSRMVQRGLVDAEALRDPWGKLFALRRTKTPVLSIAVQAAGLELSSAGPDGRFGTKDDINNPFARAVPEGSTYAVASGEDTLMREVGMLSPGENVLQQLVEAYQRVGAEIQEELVGDAVGGSLSGGYGLIGHGSGGGGMGYGSGSGRGGMRARKARVPQVRVGHTQARGGLSAFASVLREKFPATLFFAAALPVDSSGTTTIDLKLSEAITRYRVEAIVWSEDGWQWSAQTEIQVEKQIVVDAPVPAFATVGDEIVLPVRISSRSAREQQLTLSAFTSKDSDKPLADRVRVRVPAKETSTFPIQIRFSEELKGSLGVGVASATGKALDAVKRPVHVRRAARTVRKSAELLSSGSGELSLHVDKHAFEREGSEIVLRAGLNLFELRANSKQNADILSRWVSVWNKKADLVGLKPRTQANEPQMRAAYVGSVWSRYTIASRREIGVELKRLTQDIDSLSKEVRAGNDRLRELASILLYLAPAAERLSTRPKLASDMQAMLRNLRKTVRAESAAQAPNSHSLALSAAALALSAPAKSNPSHIRELVRRLRREVVQVGEYQWVASESGGHATSALLALAEIEIGKRSEAFSLLRTLARLNDRSQLHDTKAIAYSRLAMLRAGGGSRGNSLSVRVDGKPRKMKLQDGWFRVSAEELSRPGSHKIEVEAGEDSLYLLRATSVHALPWSKKTDKVGAIEVRIEGKVGAHNETSELKLFVHNRSARRIAAPIVEIALPAGTELDSKGNRILRSHLRREAGHAQGTLRLELHGLAPGAGKEIPLPLRWSLSGKLQGLGVASYPEDKPEDLSILMPRVLHIASKKVSP